MSPSPSLQARLRSLSLISICAVLLFVTVALARRQQAGSPSSRRLLNHAIRPTSGAAKNTVAPAASTITVNSTSDVANGTDGLCTLREAIIAANSNAASGALAGECVAGTGGDTDTISFSVNGTINLTSALPNINSHVDIIGPGPGQLTVRRDTGGEYRLLQITGGSTVTISGLTMANGAITGPFPANGGGAVWNNHSFLTLRNTVVSGNTANNTLPGGPGGGIFNDGSIEGSATLTIIDSTFTTNSCTGNGGAISNYGFRGVATLTITNSTFSNNTGDAGGAIYSTGQTGFATVRITNSTISGNNSRRAGGVSTSGGDGGNAKLIIINSTISGNTAQQFAGGISTDTSQTSLTNTTVTNNRAGISAGGIDIFSTSTPVFLRNTILSGNFRGSGLSADDSVGAVDSSSSFNLIGDALLSGLTNGVNNNQLFVTNPRLAPLASNGGATQTHAPLSTSPALDAGDNCVTQAAHCGDANIPQLLTDQRGPGFSRLVDGPDANTTATVDIGAYEPQAALADLPNTSTNEDTQLIVAFDPGDPSSITSITASSDNPTLVPNDSAHLSATLAGAAGLLTINPATNLFGATNITVTVARSTGNSTKTFLLTVNSVNDPPSFISGPDQTVNEDSGAQSINNWASNISAGPPEESAQTLTFQITANTNAALFSVAPSVSSTGSLTYTPAPNANGLAVLTVVLIDDGGTANGGVDTTPAQTLRITVNAVNDAPSFTKGADQTVPNDTNVQSISNWATNISRGPANESAQTLSFQVTGNTNPGLFAVPPSVSSTGTLSYQSAGNVGGTATITIVLKDSGGTANGGVDTSPSQSFNINIVPLGGFISFSAVSYNTTESSGFATITLKRSGDLTRAASADYASSVDNGLPCATANGVATPKCDFTSALGTVNFAAGEDTRLLTIPISQDSYVEGPETFSIALSNPQGSSALTSPATASVMIADDSTEPPANMIDDVRNFVRQHYHDFLNREPDQSGWDFWTDRITSCGSDVQCNEVRRIDVSASFFLSIEFQQSGYLVERFYKVAYGKGTGTSTFNGQHQLSVPVVRFDEFLKDTQRLGQGVVVLQSGWEQVLENNKRAYAEEFCLTLRSFAALPLTMTPAQFVDKLNQNAGDVLSPVERQTAINLFGGASSTSNTSARALALRQVAEDPDLYNAEFNQAFVLAQYFGYLRRNPNDAPDSDYTGYDFWLTKLNQFNGSYINAEMVKAFLSSIEYRQRFGQ
jgi:CSLREA domain-containing protein